MTSAIERDEDVQRLVELNVRIIRNTLRGMVVPSPSYALGLWAEDPELLAPTVIAIGLEPDRTRLLETQSRREARCAVWNVGDYALDAYPDPDPRSLPEFTALEEAVRSKLSAVGIYEPPQFVLNGVAMILKHDPPIAPRTPDFVVFVFNEDFSTELRKNVELGATDAALARLEAADLLPLLYEPEDGDEDEWPLDD